MAYATVEEATSFVSANYPFKTSNNFTNDSSIQEYLNYANRLINYFIADIVDNIPEIDLKEMNIIQALYLYLAYDHIFESQIDDVKNIKSKSIGSTSGSKISSSFYTRDMLAPEVKTIMQKYISFQPKVRRK